MSEEENKNNHTLLKVLGVTAAAGAAAYAGYGYYVFRNGFDLDNSVLFGKHTSPRLLTAGGERHEWFSHCVRDDEYLSSYDGLKLHALRITDNPDSHHWIIFQHGLGECSSTLLDYFYEADQRGYNILAPDARGCGFSEGRYTGLGWNEHYDLISWINFLLNYDPNAQIAVMGLDAGGNAVMNCVGDYVPSGVKCMIEDGGFSDMKEIILYTIRKHRKMNGKLFIPSVDFYVKQFLHFSMNDVSTKHQLENASVPMLFMHGTEDEVVPTSMMFDNYYAYAYEKELFTAEGAGFRETSKAEGYFETLFTFIDKYMHA
jgi:pimeloyl-ACP methyl ester carboxylesterase